jgi:hypothetical protein
MKSWSAMNPLMESGGYALIEATFEVPKQFI